MDIEIDEQTKTRPRETTERLKKGGAALALGGVTLCVIACTAPLLMGAGAVALAADLEVAGGVLAVLGVITLVGVRLLRRRRGSTCGSEEVRGGC